jgi:hypothetical protein
LNDRHPTLARSLHLNQTNHFFNLGYGWLCKHCSAEDAERKHHKQGSPAGAPHSEVPAFAYWNPSTQTLSCRRCGIEEFIRNP